MMIRLMRDAVIGGTTTVTQALQQRLSNYNKDTSCTVFYATDVTDCASFVSLEMFQLVTDSGGRVVVSKPLSNDRQPKTPLT